VEYSILGPLEVRANGETVPLGGAKQRALLAALLLHANEAVSSEQLIDELWGEHAPPTAANTLQVHLSRLRRTLVAVDGSSPLARDGDGYRLSLSSSQLDAARFEQASQRGGAALAAGDYAVALRELDAGLALWRGPALADLAYESFAQPAIARLEELRLKARTDRLEAELALGHEAAAIGDLEGLVREHPLDERLRRLQMTALYRAGRHADALDAFDGLRGALSELGLEPGHRLRALQLQILRHDAALEGTAWEPSSWRKRLGGQRGVAAATVMLAVLIFAAASGGRTEWVEASAPANALRAIDPQAGTIVENVRLPGRPGAVASSHDGVWVASVDAPVVWHVDARSRRVDRTVRLDFVADDLAAGGGALWAVSASARSMNRIDRRSGRARFALPSGTQGVVPWEPGGVAWPVWGDSAREVANNTSCWSHPRRPASLAAGGGSVWFSCGDRVVGVVDPDTGAVRTLRYRGGAPVAVAHGRSYVWVVGRADESVSQLSDLSGDTIRALTLTGDPSAIAVGGDSIWVPARELDAVWKATFDRPPATRVRARRLIPVGDRPEHVVFADGAAWVVNTADGTVSKIDARRERVATTIDVGVEAVGIATAGRMVWVAVRSPR
jgi:DNA-binding SARP family transcriptional activator/DNA-binding beta-propeller fold protein YncE